MNVKTLVVWFLSGVMAMSACLPPATPTTETATVPPATDSAVGIDETGSYSLSTRTGKAEIDVILEAVEGGDSQQLRDLLRFITIPCTTLDGLGGPPKCRDGEVEGALVEVFGFLGGEGHYLYKENVDSWEGIDITRLYAIYRNSGNVFSDESFPAGEFAILYLSSDGVPGTTLHITDGRVVRIDTVFDTSIKGLSMYLQKNASEILTQSK